jgi:hypothetical protein
MNQCLQWKFWVGAKATLADVELCSMPEIDLENMGEISFTCSIVVSEKSDTCNSDYVI